MTKPYMVQCSTKTVYVCVKKENQKELMKEDTSVKETG